MSIILLWSSQEKSWCRDNTLLRQPVDLGVGIAAIAQHAAGIRPDGLASRPADITWSAVEMRRDAGNAQLAQVRIVERRDARARNDMGILEKLLDVIDRPGGDVAFMQNLERLLLRTPDHPLRDDVVDLLRAQGAQDVGRKRGIVRQIVTPDRAKQAPRRGVGS